MVRKAILIRAVELDSPNFLGMELYTDRSRRDGEKSAWYPRGVIDSIEIDLESHIVTIGVNQRDYIPMDVGREVLLIEAK